MMFSSVRKELFDLWLNLLNTNTKGVEFSGNYTFRFWSQNQTEQEFHIVRKNEDKLEFDVDKVVPVVDVQTIEIPFVERNDRRDYEQEYYIAVKVDRKIDPDTKQVIIDFDEESPTYQAVLETVETIRTNLTFPAATSKWTIKIKEPSKVNTFKFSGSYYTIIAVNMTLTRIELGFFGNETTIKFGLESDTLTDDYLLDIVEADFIVSKGAVNPVKILDDQVQRSRPINRTWSMQMTVNFLNNEADKLLWQEIHVGHVGRRYKISVKDSIVDYSHIVVVTNINTTIRNNSVVKITFTVERV